MVKTIDEMAEQMPLPTFMKVDVEGFQNHLFREGVKFFSNEAPLIMAELRDTPETMCESENLIKGFGFEIFEITRKGMLRRCSSFLSSRSRNFVLYFVLCKPDSSCITRINSLIL